MTNHSVIAVCMLLTSFVVPVSAACPTADLSGDCRVNFADFAMLGSQWLGSDFTGVGVFSAQWLTEGIPDPAGMVWVSINDAGVSGHGGFNGQMSKYETTNAQYCQFLNAAIGSGDIAVSGTTVNGANGSNSGADFAGLPYYNTAGAGYSADGVVNGGTARIHYNGGVFIVDSGFENYPVSYVSWYGARAFCNYYGYRLPTEWEWQAVADYDGTYTYGCGTTINNSKANYAGSSHPYGTTPVGTFGTYGYGMCDMAGNVWELTSSEYFGSYYFRGGSWSMAASSCTVSWRSYLFADIMADNLGFRVCR